MRISDWSSDVCSSDLYSSVLRGILKREKVRLKNLIIVGDKVKIIPTSETEAVLVGINERKSILSRADHLSQQKEDRKSVEKGKSVSVRVALGSRRSIKKKKSKDKYIMTK